MGERRTQSEHCLRPVSGDVSKRTSEFMWLRALDAGCAFDVSPSVLRDCGAL